MLPPDEIIARIEKALATDGGGHSWDTLVPMLKAGKAQIFWNDQGAWITEIVQAPLSRWLNVWVVAGELPGVMDLQERVLEHARQNNCPRVTATARLGWKHVAREYGWHQHAMVITHEA